jgi:molecular chaperone HtpG
MTSTSDEINTSFADYKARMKEGQKAIYYVTADSLTAAKIHHSLNCLRKRALKFYSWQIVSMSGQ